MWGGATGRHLSILGPGQGTGLAVWVLIRHLVQNKCEVIEIGLEGLPMSSSVTRQ